MKNTKDLVIEAQQEEINYGKDFRDDFVQQVHERLEEEKQYERDMKKRAYVENALMIKKYEDSLENLQEWMDGVNARFVKDF